KIHSGCWGRLPNREPILRGWSLGLNGLDTESVLHFEDASTLGFRRGVGNFDDDASGGSERSRRPSQGAELGSFDIDQEPVDRREPRLLDEPIDAANRYHDPVNGIPVRAGGPSRHDRRLSIVDIRNLQ